MKRLTLLPGWEQPVASLDKGLFTVSGKVYIKVGKKGYTYDAKGELVKDLNPEATARALTPVWEE